MYPRPGKVCVMAQDIRYRIDEETTVEFAEAELTEGELGWLSGIASMQVASGSDPAYVKEMTLNMEKLAQMAFEYDLLKQVASTVEIEVLRHFRRSDETTQTTSEISDALDRSKSSISRALSRLVEKGQLTRVQQGVYRKA